MRALPSFSPPTPSLRSCWLLLGRVHTLTRARTIRRREPGSKRPAFRLARGGVGNFELVAVARRERLTIYLDRLRSSQSRHRRDGYRRDSDRQRGRPSQSIDGTYTLAAPWSAQPSRHDLIFTVASGGSTEVLTAALHMPPMVGTDAEGFNAHPQRAADYSAVGRTGLGVPIQPSSARPPAASFWACW